MNDIVNGVFEAVGGVLLWFNFVRLKRDKLVRGVLWPVTAFYALWGIWNLYYYPSLKQIFSFAGGIVVVAANVAWVALAVYYSNAEKRSERVGAK